MTDLAIKLASQQVFIPSYGKFISILDYCKASTKTGCWQLYSAPTFQQNKTSLTSAPSP